MKETKKQIIADLHLETAKIPWSELQRFFAGGKLLVLDKQEDLIEVAASLVENDIKRLQGMIDNKLISYPSDDDAKKWVKEQAHLWAVVLNPWVLVQENQDSVLSKD